MTSAPAGSRDVSSGLSRRQFLKALGWSVAAVGLTACTAQPAPTPTRASAAPVSGKAARDAIVVALFSEPTTLNPITQLADVPSIQVISNLANALVSLNPKTRTVEPELATSWTQKDPTTWVFKLREGVMFHKGFGEFTAEDVEFNVNYTVEKNKPRKFLYFFVKGAKAIDKYTVEIYLDKPFAPFLVTVPAGTAGFMMSKKAYDQMGEEAFNRSPVGTGPFEVESWKSGSEIVLKKNASYWRSDNPKLARVVFRPIVDVTVKQNLLRTGEIDFMDTPDYKDIATLRQNPNVVVSSVVGWNWDYITFNLQDSALPVASKEVRQAIASAIDREAIVKNVYYGEGEADDDPLPAGYLGADPDQQRYPNTADLTRAKELLTAAGYPNGFSLSCITSDKATLRRELELVASQLSRVGIQVQIQNLDMGTYNTRNRQNQFEMALEDITIMTPDTDSAVYWFLHSGTVGWHGHRNAELDALLDGARIEQESARRAEMYRRIIELALEEVPYVYTAHSNLVRVWRKGLAGYEPSPQDIDFRLETAYWEA